MNKQIDLHTTALNKAGYAMREPWWRRRKWLSNAQVLSTLALAEQQRLANLIALAQLSGDDERLMVLRREAIHALAERVPSSTDGDEHVVVRHTVASALGFDTSNG